MMTVFQPYPVVTNLPVITTKQMVEVDRRMMDDIGISLYQMMENAGLQLANLARDIFLGGDVTGKRIGVLVGTGGNAGGAIVAARRLTSWGATCDLGFGRDAASLAPVPKAQFDILNKISDVRQIEAGDLEVGYDLILDGLIGYSLNGGPKGGMRDFIIAANLIDVPVLSLDVPSGFDGETGVQRDPTMQAAATMTIALPKFGMLEPSAAESVGRLFCADISCPPCVYDDLGLTLGYKTPFANGPIVEVRRSY